MIKSNEIRVGNIIKKNGVFVVVDGRTIFDIWGFGLKGVTETSYVEIKLAEEILHRLGYTYCPIRENHYVLNGHTIWNAKQDGDTMFMCDKNGIIIRYAHKLQNLHYELTGKNLTYK